jgi:hypothetical protein
VRLRQVALVAEDLSTVSRRLETLLGLDPGYHDPGIIEFGLDNWVAALGDTFLEVVSPVRPNTTAGRYLERRGGDGGYMVILQVADLGAARHRIEAAGARIVWQAEGLGETADGSEELRTKGLHVHPRDCGGAILSVDQSMPPDAWVWAGPDWPDKRSRLAAMLTGVEMQSQDPEAMAKRWCELLGAQAVATERADGRRAWVLDLESTDAGDSGFPQGGRLYFVADTNGRGEGVSAFDVSVDSAARDELPRRCAELALQLRGSVEHPWVDEAGVRIFFTSPSS